MEMPVDVLTDRLGKLVDGGALHGDYTTIALNIDERLQEKFYFIPFEEINAVPIEHSKDGHSFYAGSGPETVRASKHDNPNWLYHTAVHALALWQHVARLQERTKLEQERPKIPGPGVYLVTNRTSNFSFTAIVTEDKRIKVTSRDTGTLTDQTDSMRTSTSEFVWQRIDLATGDLTA